MYQYLLAYTRWRYMLCISPHKFVNLTEDNGIKKTSFVRFIVKSFTHAYCISVWQTHRRTLNSTHINVYIWKLKKNKIVWTRFVSWAFKVCICICIVCILVSVAAVLQCNQWIETVTSTTTTTYYTHTHTDTLTITDFTLYLVRVSNIVIVQNTVEQQQWTSKILMDGKSVDTLVHLCWTEVTFHLWRKPQNQKKKNTNNWDVNVSEWIILFLLVRNNRVLE